MEKKNGKKEWKKRMEKKNGKKEWKKKVNYGVLYLRLFEFCR